ncbi:MAG TPA: hydroxymethylpyrimidine/phosphomethylpyrimidine kinase, partial [Clostridium sp.]|nr:hydroxymethylpyrimidine/phosphomethylpyrimidine kinase [Clostridium sp.]
NLAAGYSIDESILRAKKYITGALRDNLNIGKGNGPLNHCWNL